MVKREFTGYLLLACKNLNYSKEQARILLGELSILFESATSEQVEEGFKWLFNEQENRAELQLKNNRMIKAKHRMKPRKITRLPECFQSELLKENEQLIQFLRNYNSPPWKSK